MDEQDQISIPDCGITSGDVYPLNLYIQEFTPEGKTKTDFMIELAANLKTTVQNLYRLIRNKKGHILKSTSAISLLSKTSEYSIDAHEAVSDNSDS